MGVFDDSTRKLAAEARAKTVKAERLAGPYESYEGYDDGGLDVLRSLTRRTRLRLAAAMDREALAMGAVGLAVGVAIGAAVVWRRGRR